MRLVLASGSRARRRILANAGVEFEVDRAAVDERAIEGPLVANGSSPMDVALALAEAKALDAASRRPADRVIGADQVLATRQDIIVHKPADREEAAEQLRQLAGSDHWLHSALALVEHDRVVWRHVEAARLTMRDMTEREIDAYVDELPLETLTSAGIYQIEGPGIRLFEAIHGDFFAILGLPILPLLKALRELEAVA